MNEIKTFCIDYFSKFFHQDRLYGFLENFVEALIILLFFYFLTIFVKLIVQALYSRLSSDKKSVIFLLRRIINSFLMITGIISALHRLGLNVSALVAGLGLTGFALGYAFKDALSNVLAGIMIILYRPFRIGDLVKVGDFKGIVSEVDLRHTAITDKGKRHLVPNSTILSEIISVKIR
jgi:small-conductance mechanosensitive channel